MESTYVSEMTFMYPTNCSIFQKPGNVKLHPELLSKHQKYVAEKIGSSDPVRTIFFKRNMFTCPRLVIMFYHAITKVMFRYCHYVIKWQSGLLHRYRSLKGL